MKSVGETIMEARLAQGYKSRASLINGNKSIRITQEGLRKIEAGERMPKLETFRVLAETLGLPDATIGQLEGEILSRRLAQAVRRSGNVSVSFQIDGKPVRLESLPPRRKTEAFVRKVVAELCDLLEQKLRVSDQDVEYFRMFARNTLHKYLERDGY